VVPAGGRTGVAPAGGRIGWVPAGEGFFLDATLPSNFLQNTFDVGVYIPVGEADDAHAVLLQPFGSGLIVALLLWVGVMPPVNFNHQLVLVAEEIKNEAKDRVLASKLDAIQLFATQASP
jgi:hypothetical protein